MALGLVALVLGFALPVLSGAATQQARRLQDLTAAEFAASLAEEYRATFPQMQAAGTDASGWQWRITERPVAPDGPTALDDAMRLVAVQITVWPADRPSEARQFETVIARPRS